tara:strand:- start:551 stop:1063 length:513 start_codon:yes stop_codon:yes gene_type:complete
MTKKKNFIEELFETLGILIIIILCVSGLGSTVVILLSLFLFLIPNKKTRLNIFAFLIISNLIINLLLLFIPLDFGFINDLILWYSKSAPAPLDESISTLDYYIQKGYEIPIHPSQLSDIYLEEPLGITAILNAYLVNLGYVSLDNFGIFIVFDLVFFFLYFYFGSWLINE